MRHFLLSILMLGCLNQALLAQSNCILTPNSPNICAGIDVGARGIKPIVIQINPSTLGRKTVELRRMSKDLKADNSFDLLRDTTEVMIDCAARHIGKYVEIFQGPLYSVAPEKIFVVLSSGLVGVLKSQPKRLALLKKKIKEYSGIEAAELSEKDEGELTVRSVTSDDDLKKAQVHVLDIGSGSIKGGYSEDDDYINQFSAIVGVRSIAAKLDSMAKADNLDVNNPDHRYLLARFARNYFKTNFLDTGKPLDVAKKTTEGVCWEGGIVYVFTTWFKPEEIAGGKKYITFRLDDVDYFFQKVVSSHNNEELFKNSPQLEEGMTRASREFFADAKKVIDRKSVV